MFRKVAGNIFRPLIGLLMSPQQKEIILHLCKQRKATDLFRTQYFLLGFSASTAFLTDLEH